MNIEDARGYAQNAFAQEINTVYRAYIDMAGDLIAGHLFSQIMYWFKPSADGKSKLRVKKKDGYWLAKSREDWYKEIRISPKQYDRAVKILRDKGLVETKLYRFNGSPMVHIRPNMVVYNQLLNEWIENKAQEILKEDDEKPDNITFLPKGENPNLQKVKMETTETVKTLTKTTSNTTKQIIPNGDNKENNSEPSCSIVTPIESKAGKWEWESDKQYVDYIEKVLPKMIKKMASNYGKKSDTAYNVFLTITAYYFEQYRVFNGSYHAWYREDTLRECFNALFEFFDDHIDISDVKDYINQFFTHKTLRKKPFKVFCSYNMLDTLRKELDQDWHEEYYCY